MLRSNFVFHRSLDRVCRMNEKGSNTWKDWNIFLAFSCPLEWESAINNTVGYQPRKILTFEIFVFFLLLSGTKCSQGSCQGPRNGENYYFSRIDNRLHKTKQIVSFLNLFIIFIMYQENVEYPFPVLLKAVLKTSP